MPYFVIALALTNLLALGCRQDFLEFSCVVSHMNLCSLPIRDSGLFAVELKENFVVTFRIAVRIQKFRNNYL